MIAFGTFKATLLLSVTGALGGETTFCMGVGTGADVEVGVEAAVDEDINSGVLGENDDPLELEDEPPCVILGGALGATLGAELMFCKEAGKGVDDSVGVEAALDGDAKLGVLGEDDDELEPACSLMTF